MKILRILHWVSRCSLGAIFIYSGYVKCGAVSFSGSHLIQFEVPLQFASAIDGYRLVPPDLVFPLATYLPWFEIALGIFLLIGWKIRYSAMVTAALLLSFMTVLTITYARGIEASCGCFSMDDPISPLTIARDSLILIPALFLIFEPRIRSRLKEPVQVST